MPPKRGRPRLVDIWRAEEVAEPDVNVDLAPNPLAVADAAPPRARAKGRGARARARPAPDPVTDARRAVVDSLSLPVNVVQESLGRALPQAVPALAPCVMDAVEKADQISILDGSDDPTATWLRDFWTDPKYKVWSSNSRASQCVTTGNTAHWLRDSEREAAALTDVVERHQQSLYLDRRR